MNTFIKDTLFYFLLTFAIGYLLCMFVDGDILLKESTRSTLVLTVLIFNFFIVVIRFLLGIKEDE